MTWSISTQKKCTRWCSTWSTRTLDNMPATIRGYSLLSHPRISGIMIPSKIGRKLLKAYRRSLLKTCVSEILRGQDKRWIISKRLDSPSQLWSITRISFLSMRLTNPNTGGTSLNTRSQGMKPMGYFTSSLTSTKLCARLRKRWARRWLK